MAPKTEEQFEEIREQKNALIKKVALKLFAEQGYHQTSISKIAKEAKISKGLMYNYFESKENLLVSILNDGFDEMMQYFDLNKDGTLEIQEMKYYIENTINTLKQNTDFWRFYFLVSLQPDVFPLIKDKMESVLQPLMKITYDYFEKNGFEDPESETLIFGALFDGLAMDYVFAPDLFPIDKVKNALIKKYCNSEQ